MPVLAGGQLGLVLAVQLGRGLLSALRVQNCSKTTAAARPASAATMSVSSTER